MRISIYEDDPGFVYYNSLLANGHTAHAFLDGIEVLHCCTADDAERFVMRPVLDADGNVQIDPEKGNCVWIERVTGDVQIEIR